MPVTPRHRLAALVAALVAVPAALLAQDWDYGTRNTPHLAPAFAGQTRAPKLVTTPPPRVEVVARGLEHPWGIAVLPDGRYLVTERPGRLRLVGRDGTVSAPVANLPAVLARRQGGLLDVAIAPDFATSRRIYLTYAKPLGGALSATAAATALLSADGRALEALREIFVQDPPSPTPAHYGARILPDGDHLWITTGEHFTEAERRLAQDPAASYGKVIRLGADGSLPPDNPFAGGPGAAPQVWSLGHRNIQGAAIEPATGALWTLEHGPRGGDELNRIEKGANYGWPVVSYGENYDGTPIGSGKAHGAGVTEPRYFWDPVIAPGGFQFYTGTLFAGWRGNVIAASLNPGGVVRLVLDGDRVTGEERLLHGQARIRDVEIDRDGAILVLTDEPQGRILRLSPGG